MSAPFLRVFIVLCAVCFFPGGASAQWLTQPTKGIPRTADGKPNLTAATPRTADGRPDLSGLWEAGPKFETDFKPSDAQSWALSKSREREANPAADGWSTLCLPPGPMITFSGPVKIVQASDAVTILYEVPNNFRQIFTDGRALPKDPNPTWQGYSVGRWDGDTFVVETMGFNDKSWIGRPGYPHTEALRVTERYRRRDFGHMDYQLMVDDPKAFTRSWSINTELVLHPDTEMLEFVCNENEKDRQHFVQPSSTSSVITVDPALLAKYAGVYQVPAPRGLIDATVRVEGDQLIIDAQSQGSGVLVPISQTMFRFRGVTLEFVSNDMGEVTHLIAHAVEGDFKGPRIK